jgi:hypothetical protein
MNSALRTLLTLTAGNSLDRRCTRKQQTPAKSTAGMAVTVVTHTGKADFNAYVLQFAKTVKHNWIASWPESAKAGEAAIVVARSQISKHKTLINDSLRIERSSGRDPFDSAAIGALRASAAFPSLPSGFEGSNIDLRITLFLQRTDKVSPESGAIEDTTRRNIAKVRPTCDRSFLDDI